MDAIRAALRGGDAPVPGVIQDALTKVRAVVTQTTGPSLTSLRVRDMLAAQTVDKAGSRNSFRD